MKGISTRRVAVVAALAACALTVGPLTSQASAIPTKTVAHSTVLDLSIPSLNGSLPLRPSAHVTRTDTGAPVANKVVQFLAIGGLSMKQNLCAVRTDNFGYAQCEGLVRVTNSLLVLGRYTAKFPKQGDFAASQDKGQLITIGEASIVN